MLAILAYRNWGREERGITEPNIVIPETAHAAFYRACAYFGMEVRVADIDQKSYKVNVADLRKKIDDNTVCVC